nr:hypothetical protein [Tanacetum cinerariifolium]
VIGIHVMLLPEPVFFVICLITLKETLCPKQAASAVGKRPLSTTSFSHAYAARGASAVGKRPLSTTSFSHAYAARGSIIGIHVMLLPDPVFFVICLITLKETLYPKQATSAVGKRPLSTTSFSQAYAARGGEPPPTD